MRIAKVIGSILAVLAVAYVALVLYEDSVTPKRNRCLIPEGYAGWLCASYQVAKP
jgi:hypothetical protein